MYIMSYVHIKDRKIKRVKITKSLSIMIDETLLRNAQVDQTTKKVNSGLSIQRRLRDEVDFRTLLSIYLSLIQPCFRHCLFLKFF